MDDALERGSVDGTPKREDLDGALKREGLDGALKRAEGLKLMIFDVDGVMTDGTLYYSERGEELKAFNIQDGLGIKMLRQYGVEVALITARSSRAVELRAASLGIAHLYQGAEDKRGAYAALLAQMDLAAEQSGYMGDDLLDLPLITRCGFAATVPAAPAGAEEPRPLRDARARRPWRRARSVRIHPARPGHARTRHRRAFAMNRIR